MPSESPPPASPLVPAERIQRLKDRHAIVRALRAHLDAEDFVEVQSPLLVRGACPEVHITPFSVAMAGGREPRYLVSSTEYQLKRLIASGLERPYSLTQNFRQGDEGPLHNPEFTMLEWARVGVSLDAIEADAEQLIRGACAALRAVSERPRSAGAANHAGELAVVRDGARIDLKRPFARQSVRGALHQHLGAVVDEAFSIDSLVAAADKARVHVPASMRHDAHEVFSVLLAELQRHLGFDRPIFLRDWPAFMTASAAAAEGRPSLALRSELFVAGIEIADGFPSLRSPVEQEAAFRRELARRAALGLPEVELDGRYLRALGSGLPAGAGMALGVDRLVLVLTGARTLREVMAFAWDEV